VGVVLLGATPSWSLGIGFVFFDVKIVGNGAAAGVVQIVQLPMM